MPQGFLKRPLSVRIIAAIYVLYPVLAFLQVRFLYENAPTTLSGIVERFTGYTWVLMVSSVVVGVGLYQVRRWGWYLFLVHVGIVLVYNVHIYRSGSYAPLWVLVTSQSVLLSVAGYFIWSNVSAPYFNPRLRWWERTDRVTGVFEAILEREDGQGLHGETMDFSESGVYVKCKQSLLTPGARVQVRLRFHRDTVEARAEVVRRVSGNDRIPDGVGLRFIKLDAKNRKILREVFRDVKAYRAATERPATLI